MTPPKRCPGLEPGPRLHRRRAQGRPRTSLTNFSTPLYPGPRAGTQAAPSLGIGPTATRFHGWAPARWPGNRGTWFKGWAPARWPGNRGTRFRCRRRNDFPGPSPGRRQTANSSIAPLAAPPRALSSPPQPPRQGDPAMPLDEATFEAYREDGVAVLRGVFSDDWIDRLRQGVAENMATPGRYTKGYTKAGDPGHFFGDYCNWARIQAYRDFLFDSPAPRLAAELMGCKKVNLFHEHVLVKEPATRDRTPWPALLPRRRARQLLAVGAARPGARRNLRRVRRRAIRARGRRLRKCPRHRRRAQGPPPAALGAAAGRRHRLPLPDRARAPLATPAKPPAAAPSPPASPATTPGMPCAKARCRRRSRR